MEISWTDRVRNEVLGSVKETGNILHRLRRRKANCIGHILRRSCLLKRIIEGKIGEMHVTGRKRRRRKELLDDCNERRG